VNGAQVVVKVGAAAAVLCVARHANAGPTLAPTAHPTNVLVLQVRKEHVRTEAQPLEAPTETPRMRRQDGKVGRVLDGDEKIDVFRPRL
jgi:hypothetical protein